MWNDTDEPIAYLITFRTYGTWLHGDERGSIDRHNNKYGQPRIPQNQKWKDYNARALTGEPVRLNGRQRAKVRAAIKDTCKKRGWILYAIAVRTNHVHVVVAAHGRKPEIFLNAFKANATRLMRESGFWSYTYSPWVDKGSKRKLWNDKHVTDACDYVEFGQGLPLPDFD
jgi:REP element-mobilizing transposase RayT